MRWTACSLLIALPLAHANDFDWVTIADLGNEPYDGGEWGQTAGRGRVDYLYRIGRAEVTTGQWLEYINTFTVLGGDWEFFVYPVFWGAERDPEYEGPGRKYRLRSDVPTPELLPVTGISWYDAAKFCNWLHNGKSSDAASLDTGAYDTSTWGFDEKTQTYTDHATHLPGAQFWIPTVDEWLKAAHYDPDRYGQGQGGWWEYNNSSDELPVPGLPGEGETSANLELDFFGEWDIPLGAYPDTLSAWGLLDLSGGAQEWLEDWAHPETPQDRLLDGSYAGSPGWFWQDRADAFGDGTDPWGGGAVFGLRLVAAVPSPSTALVVSVGLRVCSRRQRRSHAP